MFEPETETERETERRRSRLVMMLGAAGALVLAIAVMLVTRQSMKSSELDRFVRAGAAEFESYKDQVVLDDQETLVYPNLLEMVQLVVRARLTNRGQRTLTGVEIIGKVYDLQDKVVAQAVSFPIPRARTQPLPPGDSMRIIVRVDVPAKIKEADVKDVKIELQGLRFQ